jgi:hypothetical protein
MLDFIGSLALLLFGPLMVGSFVLLFTYPIGQMVMEARDRPAWQAAWTWVMGFVAMMALYAISGISLL